jgi:hypothetical protein
VGLLKMKSILAFLMLAGVTLGAGSATLALENIPAGTILTLASSGFIHSIGGDILTQSFSFKPNSRRPLVSVRVREVSYENISVKNIIYDGGTLPFELDKKRWSGSGTSTQDHNIKITGSVNSEGTASERINNVSTPAAIWLFGSAFMGLVGISIRKNRG